MQDYTLFFLQSILFFIFDIGIYCITHYQLTYAVLLYYCILLIKKSSCIKISFLFFLLFAENWFFYGQALLATAHIPLAYVIWYRHHTYLYFNSFLFTALCAGSFMIQLCIEYGVLHVNDHYYIYPKLCGIIAGIGYGMQQMHAYHNSTAKKRQ